VGGGHGIGDLGYMMLLLHQWLHERSREGCG
jgi:hypothetical protein